MPNELTKKVQRMTVNDRPIAWREGMTVQDALDIMGYDFSQIMVTINNQVIAEEDYKTHKVPLGAEMKAIHLHHGG
jgi:thiamine biosynthesis protein ThiS